MKKINIIETKTGKLQGYIENGISIFKRNPYVQPPVGKLRLKAPVLKKSWEFRPEIPKSISAITPSLSRE
ncbi:MAG: carboxylesterase family protein [Promethearchaeota archaeon]